MILFTCVDYLPCAVFDTITLKAGQTSTETIAFVFFGWFFKNIIGYVWNHGLLICFPCVCIAWENRTVTYSDAHFDRKANFVYMFLTAWKLYSWLKVSVNRKDWTVLNFLYRICGFNETMKNTCNWTTWEHNLGSLYGDDSGERPLILILVETNKIYNFASAVVFIYDLFQKIHN